ncbi:hypothetical protein WHR41_03683 [Cladosporium halotolerans]|uniref:Uncharacterized protein n=1 Tax=Cladosporium halotolerans TaxID=1052096 RepID=A0AB34KRX6_9PEZI
MAPFKAKRAPRVKYVVENTFGEHPTERDKGHSATAATAQPSAAPPTSLPPTDNRNAPTTPLAEIIKERIHAITRSAEAVSNPAADSDTSADMARRGGPKKATPDQVKELTSKSHSSGKANSDSSKPAASTASSKGKSRADSTGPATASKPPGSGTSSGRQQPSRTDQSPQKGRSERVSSFRGTAANNEAGFPAKTASTIPANSSWEASLNDPSATQATGTWDPGHPPYKSDSYFRREQLRAEQAKASKTSADLKGKGRQEVNQKPSEYRKSPWLKNSEIPKGDPKRHQTRWSSSSASSIDSNRVSSGWGDCMKSADAVRGDLADWAGGIGPAAIDWDSRPRFRDNQSAEKMEVWLDVIFSELADVHYTMTFFPSPESLEAKAFDATVSDHIAPRHWVPDTVDLLPADAFWAEHIQSNKPEPLGEFDLADAEPWWQTYHNSECNNIPLLRFPAVVGVDPNEDKEQKLKRELDFGSNHATTNRINFEKAKKQMARDRALAKRNNAHKFSGAYKEVINENAIKPGLNMFLRSARREDVVQLRDIYNRYIDNAYVVPETDRLTDADMAQRLVKGKDAVLPFIVACQRGERVKDVVMPDRVVGFACAVDLKEKHSIYRPSVLLEIFVPMEHYMKNIGNCLLDKMMCLLDPGYFSRGGYDCFGDELDGTGAIRDVSNVLIRYPYDAANSDKLEWVSKWLKKRAGFEKVADLKGVAKKFDKDLNLAILQKKTGLTLEYFDDPPAQDNPAPDA